MFGLAAIIHIKRRIMKKHLWITYSAMFALLMTGITAQAQTETATAEDNHIDVQIGTEWSRGTYGETTTTRIQSTSLTLRYRTPSWIFSAEVPWLRIQGDTSAALPDTIGTSTSANTSGMGDIWLKVSHELTPLTTDNIGLDLTVKIKTASGDVNKGLGSGATDIAMQLEGSKMITSSVLMFGQVGYRNTGDVAGQRPYGNPFYAEAGIQAKHNQHHEYGTYYSTRQAIGRLGALQEWTGFASWHDKSYKIEFYVTRGLSQASPEWAAGLTTRKRF